jgi:hypothetical protein
MVQEFQCAAQLRIEADAALALARRPSRLVNTQGWRAARRPQRRSRAAFGGALYRDVRTCSRASRRVGFGTRARAAQLNASVSRTRRGHAGSTVLMCLDNIHVRVDGERPQAERIVQAQRLNER